MCVYCLLDVCSVFIFCILTILDSCEIVLEFYHNFRHFFEESVNWINLIDSTQFQLIFIFFSIEIRAFLWWQTNERIKLVFTNSIHRLDRFHVKPHHRLNLKLMNKSNHIWLLVCIKSSKIKRNTRLKFKSNTLWGKKNKCCETSKWV